MAQAHPALCPLINYVTDAARAVPKPPVKISQISGEARVEYYDSDSDLMK